MRFEEAYTGWQGKRLTQQEAGQLLGGPIFGALACGWKFTAGESSRRAGGCASRICLDCPQSPVSACFYWAMRNRHPIGTESRIGRGEGR